MNLPKTIVILLVLSLFGLVGCGKQQTSALVSGPDLYAKYCASCHGANGAGGRASDLNNGQWKNSSSQVQSLIINGTPGMPSYPNLTAVQVKAIGDYVAGL